MVAVEKVVVVIPTYNERDNLGPLLEALQKQFQGMDQEMHVLVVDDNSPDGTAEVAREAGRRWGNVHLLSGEKRGLGVAYVRGIQHALQELDADVVVQMDADFSHNPADVPRLVAALEGGADFVIGSRYVKGGRAPEDWGPLRRGISLLANLGARFIAGLYRVHDCTNGFRAIRGSLLRRIDLVEAPPRGYAILVYLIYQALSLGARVQEVPVSFSNRSQGESKLRWTDVLEFLINVWWVRYDRREKFYRLAAGGLSGIAANLAALAVLHGLVGLAPAIASALALEVAILYSFAWNHLWTVAARRAFAPRVVLRLARFHLLSLPSFLLTYAVFLSLTSFFDIHVVAAQALGILPALVWNYFLGERVLDRLWEGLSARFSGLSRSAGISGSRNAAERAPTIDVRDTVGQKGKR